ncbi:MAG: hypothetical protein A2787_03395 [Omnitrophica WOR_2 bacterium RIFCSPHIGHO2_01_FULL_48_9]|nr:MAG: hypothetical protein A3D10_00950 [Omnitrophica WOR_2 bacterium RIFCSPHIGHO2_02_FULL_48_11]OGX32060.1 MAG: hypothetical protein A2787_03395 [Omnitrophica WOR_2 bacterium RIFCSPHIGHO2_01_FULL_48_9]
MIVKLSGKLIQKAEQSLVLNVQGVHYEILVPASVLSRIDQHVNAEGNVDLIVYHYFQISPSSGFPVMVGFLNEIERDFFLQFIKVSGIGPRAAIKALEKPISEIATAIEAGDHKSLQALPGIGVQKAREIIAKLQGKVGKYGLIQDRGIVARRSETQPVPDWQEEALEVLLQLQYKRPEAMDMMQKALQRSGGIKTAEDLLNEIYKQRIKI